MDYIELMKNIAVGVKVSYSKNKDYEESFDKFDELPLYEGIVTEIKCYGSYLDDPKCLIKDIIHEIDFIEAGEMEL